MKYILIESLFSGICTLPVLLILRKNIRVTDTVWARFSLVVYVLYLSTMFNVVGIPGIPYLSLGPNVNLIPFSDFGDSRFFWLSGMNVLMTVPLGFLLPQIWGCYRRFSSTALTGMLTALSIELLQLFSSRATDVDDLIFNTLGVCLGYLAAKLLTGRHWRIGVQNERQERCSLLCVNGIVFFFHFFLRFPVLNLLYSLLH